MELGCTNPGLGPGTERLQGLHSLSLGSGVQRWKLIPVSSLLSQSSVNSCTSVRGAREL